MSNIMFQLIIFALTFALVSGKDQIPYRSSIESPLEVGNFEQLILSPNRFQMNQSFSLSTSMGNNMSQTTGIYSNFISYKLSERMNVNTGLHLIQSQNSLSHLKTLKIQTVLQQQLKMNRQILWQAYQLNIMVLNKQFSI